MYISLFSFALVKVKWASNVLHLLDELVLSTFYTPFSILHSRFTLVCILYVYARSICMQYIHSICTYIHALYTVYHICVSYYSVVNFRSRIYEPFSIHTKKFFSVHSLVKHCVVNGRRTVSGTVLWKFMLQWIKVSDCKFEKSIFCSASDQQQYLHCFTNCLVCLGANIINLRIHNNLFAGIPLAIFSLPTSTQYI